MQIGITLFLRHSRAALKHWETLFKRAQGQHRQSNIMFVKLQNVTIIVQSFQQLSFASDRTKDKLIFQ